jgi:hypothetical protein
VIPEKSDPVMNRWLKPSGPTNLNHDKESSRCPAWTRMILRLDALNRHRRAFLVIQRANGGEQQLSELQYEAAVKRELHVAVVTAPQGYATFLSLLLRPAPAPVSAPNRVGSITNGNGPSPLAILRQALTASRPALTRRDVVAMIATLPGVNAEVADAMLRRFHSLGAVLTASEDDLAAVPGVAPLQVHRNRQLCF